MIVKCFMQLERQKQRDSLFTQQLPGRSTTLTIAPPPDETDDFWMKIWSQSWNEVARFTKEAVPAGLLINDGITHLIEILFAEFLAYSN